MIGYVYAINDHEGRVKIGWSNNPVRRLSEINVVRATRASLYGFVAATRAQEAELHDLLTPWHVSGEWFRLEGPVLAFVEMLPKPKPKPVVSFGPVADALRAAREQLGETQIEFARRFGVAQGVLSRWETMNRRPHAAAMTLIERVLTELPEAAE